MRGRDFAAFMLALAAACGSGRVEPLLDRPPGDGGGLSADAGPDGAGGARPGSDGGDAGSDGGPGADPDGAFPIEHVIVIVKENHTFDNYFGSFPGAEGTGTFQRSDGGVGLCGHAPQNTPRDLNHTDAPGLTDWNDGGLNGWALVSGSTVSGDALAY